MTVKSIPITTVGDLREALTGLADDKLIIFQVVSQDGKAWSLEPRFTPELPKAGFSVMTLTHQELKTLPDIN